MLNKMAMIGRIGKSIDVKYMQSGDAVANFSVALSERYKDRDGNQQEKTEWVNVVVYGKRAETCSQYLGKGSLVYVEGKLTTRKWQDKNGVDRYTTEVIASDVKFLDKKADSQSQGYSDSGSPFPAQDSIDDLPF